MSFPHSGQVNLLLMFGSRMMVIVLVFELLFVVGDFWCRPGDKSCRSLLSAACCLLLLAAFLTVVGKVDPIFDRDQLA